jgi:fructuronate reductase
VERPAYSRADLKAGILHLGVGAFHRCHQAEWTDDALAAEFGSWGIVGVNLRAPDLGCTLGRQDNLYCRELRESGGVSRRLIGSIVRTLPVLDAVYDPFRITLREALEAAADPAIRLITLTVTEKGYCHTPSTGEFDPTHPDVRHDVEHPDRPRSVPGFIVRALTLRRERDVGMPVFISCDNLPQNGAILRRSVISLARMTDSRLADLIEDQVSFLNSVVDRIVPATREADLASFTADTGLEDYGLVVGEPFRMWVIENPKRLPLPAWERAGALVVDDAIPYEILKMRVLNGIQSNVSNLGLLAGMEFMSDVMADKRFIAFARCTILDEVVPYLPEVAGIDFETYVNQSIRRLQNPDLRHSNLQISTDGSQKIRQRLLEPLRAALNGGTACDGLLMGLAGWMQYVSGANWRGEALEVRDPLAPLFKQAVQAAAGDPRALVEKLLQVEAVFGPDLIDQQGMVDTLTHFVSELGRQPALDVVAALLERKGWAEASPVSTPSHALGR